jgi:hypothetical protein
MLNVKLATIVSMKDNEAEKYFVAFKIHEVQEVPKIDDHLSFINVGSLRVISVSDQDELIVIGVIAIDAWKDLERRDWEPDVVKKWINRFNKDGWSTSKPGDEK